MSADRPCMNPAAAPMYFSAGPRGWGSEQARGGTVAFDVRRCFRSFALATLVAALGLSGAGAPPAQARHRGQASGATAVAGSWSATTAARGATVVVRGTVSTVSVRRTVALQRLTSHGWRTVGTRRV
jgi:hypothetical protein